MVEWYKKRGEEVRVAFQELFSLNAKLTSPMIQKEICESYALEI
jgi:hypothetical protein